jgi:chemotaxis protein MotB
VAGHTDNVKYGGGPFNDNWGLSLARARRVLLFLIGPATPHDAKDTKPGTKHEATGGGLPEHFWAAAGYGETDPAEGTPESQSPDQRQKNRRVELVVQPNVEEMLNLNNIK